MKFRNAEKVGKCRHHLQICLGGAKEKYHTLECNTSLAAPGAGALAHRLQRHNACKIINGHQADRLWKSVYP